MTPMQTMLLIAALMISGAVYFATRKPKPPRATKTVSFYGDSITRGDGLNPRPVERRTELSKGAFIGVDYSLGGSTVHDATTGDPRLPYRGPFADWIKQDMSEIVVIGHGGANALRYPDKIGEYDTLLTAMINQSRAQGKTVVLSGMTWVAHPVKGLSEADSTRVLSGLATFDDRTEAIAMREGCVFLDLRSVPFTGAADMLDEVHPNQDYSDRVSAYVTARLVGLIEES